MDQQLEKLNALAESLRDGDIHHYAAKLAVEALIENWKMIADEVADNGISEEAADPDNLISQYDAMLEVIGSLRDDVYKLLHASHSGPAPVRPSQRF